MMQGFEIVGTALQITIPTLVCAVLTMLACAFLYFVYPKKAVNRGSLAAFALLLITIALLILGSGAVTSPFVAVWLLIAIFAGVFGIYGYIGVLAGAFAFAAAEYLDHTLNIQTLTTTVLISFVPMIASYLIWHSRKAGGTNSKDRAYKELATELSEVATQSEVVINAIGDGVIALDGQGLIQLINPAAQQILGWGKQDAAGLSYKSVLQLIDKKDNELDVTVDPIQQVMNNNQQLRTNDFSTKTKNTKKLMLSIVVSPIGEAGSGVIVVFRDITKEMAESREQAEFISTASHEMRTPVASIEGYLGLALNPATAQIDEKARDFILKAHESAQHLGRLFQDLLDVSKADDGRLSNVPKVVDVMDYTHDIVQGLEEKATDKGLKLTFKPIPDDNEKHIAPVYSVNLDNDHIREIINNLTENAIKYTPAGEVIVDVEGTEDKVIISVKDSGIGIPAEDMPHLFQKFYRVDNVDTRQIGGTGLGLYLCRRLAETMGGRIWVESEYKKGSTFYLELPRIDNTEAARLAEFQAQEAAKAAAEVSTPGFTTDTQSVPVDTTPVTGDVKPASTVPRGESLTPEQIAEHVARLRAMAQNMGTATPDQPATQTPQRQSQPQAPIVQTPPVQAPIQPQQPITPPVQQAPIQPPVPTQPLQQIPQPMTQQQPAAYQPQSFTQTRAQAGQVSNTPLTSIEQNPTAYAPQPGARPYMQSAPSRANTEIPRQ